MAKEFDKAVLNDALVKIVEEVFEKVCRVKASADPVAKECDIIESNGRLSIDPMQKFNTTAYAAAVNYFLSPRDQEQEAPVGTLVLIVKEEVMDKLAKALGRSARDTDDEEGMMDACGEMAQIMADNFRNELGRLGYAELIVSPVQKYRNVIRGGVPFDYSLYRKQEISFSFWNQKSVVLEACLGAVPLKGR